MPRRARNRDNAPQGDLNVSAASREIEKLLAARRFKDAVKQAQLLIQRENIPAHRVLLERAYFLRIEQLWRGGMRAAAAEVAGHLIERIITDDGVLRDVVRLLPALGMWGQAFALSRRIDTPEFQSAFINLAADQAVLQFDENAEIPPDVRNGAVAVRAALQALDAGRDDLAFEQFRDVPRSSPFADWRLFVRGLAALRRGDHHQVAANWDRLDSERTAGRIARQLRSPRAPADSAEQFVNSSNQAALESRVFGEPVLARLGQLGEFVRLGQWHDAIKILGPLCTSLRRIDVPLAQRLTGVLLHPLADALPRQSENAACRLTADFMRVAEPPALDPNWNRFQAILFEMNGHDLKPAIKHWRMLVADLGSAAQLPPEKRRVMQAIVVRHIAELFAILSTPPEAEFNLGLFDQAESARPSPELRRKAIDAVEESLRLDPTRKKCYELLLQLHEAWEQPDAAAAAARRLLAAFPDDLDRLLHLVEYHVRRDEPGHALPLVEQARRLKPLDQTLACRELSVRQGIARHHALAGRWDEGRAEFARVAAAWPESDSRDILLARMATFEYKAGQPLRGDILLSEGINPLDDKTPLYLSLSIEANRYQLPAPARDRAFQLLQDGLAKKVHGRTAAELSTILAGFVCNGVDYPGRDRHVSGVVAYLMRGARTKYQLDELLAICHFLSIVPSAKGFHDKTVRRGLKKFPNSAHFLTFDALLELDDGPLDADLTRIQRQLEKALELVQAADKPAEDNLEEIVKQNLSTVRALLSGSFGTAFAGGRMPGAGLPPDIADFLGGIFSDDEQRDDDLPDHGDLDFFFGRRSKPRSRRKSQ